MSATIAQQTADHPHHDQGYHGERLQSVTVYDPEAPTDVVLGKIELYRCTQCPHIRVNCEHDRRSWKHRSDCDGRGELVQLNPSAYEECRGCLLECHLCGADLT